jgi:hypothetical protein
MTHDARAYCGTAINLISQCDYDAAAHLSGLPKFSAEKLSKAFGNTPFISPNSHAWDADSEVSCSGGQVMVRCPKIEINGRIIIVEMAVEPSDLLPRSRMQSITSLPASDLDLGTD